MKPIIFFDGVCGLCNHVVLFVLKRDQKGFFRFAPLQGDYARSELPKFGGEPEELNTFYVLTFDSSGTPNLLDKSTAACYVLSELGGFWKVLSTGKILPKILRDMIYSLVAKTRYRFFGKKEVCMIPEPEWTERFVEDS